MNIQDRLRTLLVERSLRLGDFTLASGARSTYYVDARRTTMTAEGQALIGRLGWEALREAGLYPTHVGGLTLGADPVSYAIAHHSWLMGSPVDAFTIRKVAKQHGTGQRIEGGLPSSASVVVIEDSLTTGGSALEAIEVLREQGVSILGLLAVVDREEGARERLTSEGISRIVTLVRAKELLEMAAQSSNLSGMTRQR
jgi:orotate phosphoribosyltransferase